MTMTESHFLNCRKTVVAAISRLPAASSLALALVWLVGAGCAGTSHTGDSHQWSEFSVQAQGGDAAFGEVGLLKLHRDGHSLLTVTAKGSEADRLRAAWNTVNGRAELDAKVRDAEGRLVGRKVKRGASDYPAAVTDVMSREFGYFLTPVAK